MCLIILGCKDQSLINRRSLMSLQNVKWEFAKKWTIKEPKDKHKESKDLAREWEETEKRKKHRRHQRKSCWNIRRCTKITRNFSQLTIQTWLNKLLLNTSWAKTSSPKSKIKSTKSSLPNKSKPRMVSHTMISISVLESWRSMKKNPVLNSPNQMETTFSSLRSTTISSKTYWTPLMILNMLEAYYFQPMQSHQHCLNDILSNAFELKIL